jgi:hypothetical protein
VDRSTIDENLLAYPSKTGFSFGNNRNYSPSPKKKEGMGLVGESISM